MENNVIQPDIVSSGEIKFCRIILGYQISYHLSIYSSEIQARIRRIAKIDRHGMRKAAATR